MDPASFGGLLLPGDEDEVAARVRVERFRFVAAVELEADKTGVGRQGLEFRLLDGYGLGVGL